MLGATVYAVIMLSNIYTAVDETAVVGAVLACIFAIAIIAPIYLIGMALALIGLILAKRKGAKVGVFVLELLLPILLMVGYYVTMTLS